MKFLCNQGHLHNAQWRADNCATCKRKRHPKMPPSNNVPTRPRVADQTTGKGKQSVVRPSRALKLTGNGEPSMSEVQASCADEGTSNVRFHVVTRNRGIWYPACGTGNDGTTMMSAQTVPAHSVSANSRCRKPGCRKAYALADATP